jgi:hypothetical protein
MSDSTVEYQRLPSSPAPSAPPLYPALDTRLEKLERKMDRILNINSTAPTIDIAKCIAKGDFQAVINHLPKITKLTKHQLRIMIDIEPNQSLTKGKSAPGRIQLWKALLVRTKLTGDQLSSIHYRSTSTGEQLPTTPLLVLIVRGDEEIHNWIRQNVKLDESLKKAVIQWRLQGDSILEWCMFHRNIFALENLRKLVFPQSNKPVLPVESTSHWSWPTVKRECDHLHVPFDNTHVALLKYWIDTICPLLYK